MTGRDRHDGIVGWVRTSRAGHGAWRAVARCVPVLLVPSALVAGCGDSAEDAPGSTPAPTAAIEEREQATEAAARELAPVLVDELAVDAVMQARLRYASCGSPQLHGVKVTVEDAAGGTDADLALAGPAVADRLGALGWEVETQRDDLVVAQRGLLELRLQMGPGAVPWSIISDCADTPSDVGRDYVDREEQTVDLGSDG